MPGIPREVTEHALKIRLGSQPVKQRLCRFDEEKHRAISEEIAKLLLVGFHGTYHTILGRPCYINFMVVPNYTYLKLKMPGPCGVITVDTSF